MDSGLQSLLLSWVVKSLSLVALILLTYYVLVRGAIQPWFEGRRREFPLITTTVFVLAFGAWLLYANFETAFRDNASINNPLMHRREKEKNNQPPEFKAIDPETLEEKSKRLLEEAQKKHKDSVNQFDKIPNAKDR